MSDSDFVEKHERELTELRIQHKLRSAFLSTFPPDRNDVALVISAIKNQCGANELDARNVKPDLVVFWNWFLSMLGIRDPSVGGMVNINLTDPTAYQNYIQEIRAIMPLANMNDVTQELSQIGGEEDGNRT